MNKHSPVWSLQEAKAKFSEVVRRAQSEGPQTVTVHGKETVTITAVAGSAHAAPQLTGRDFVKALRQGLHFEIEIPERPKDGVFREVEF